MMNGRPATNRLYIFTITALTVFLIGITVWRVPVRGYVIRASVDGPLADAENHHVDWESEISTVRDTVNLLGVLQHVGLEDPKKQVAELTDAEQLRQLLSIELRPAEPGRVHVDLVLQATRSDWAVTVLNHLAGELASPRSSGGGSRVSGSGNLRSRWQEARHYERKARFELENHLAQMMIKLEGDENSTSTDEPAVGDPDNARDWPPPAISNENAETPDETSRDSRENPVWSELDNQRQQLALQRDLLLTRRTTAHPEVVEVAARIHDIERQLAATDRFLDMSPPVETDSENSVIRREEPSSLVLVELAATARQYQRLQADYEMAVHRLEQVESQWQEKTLTGSTAPEAHPQRRLAEPARVTEHLGGRPSTFRISVIGFVAIALGMVTVWLSASIRSFHSLGDVRRELPLPLVGHLSVVDESPDRLSRGRRRIWSRRLTLGCEVTLGLCACIALITAVTGSPMASEFAADPFGTFAETMVRAATGQFLLDL